MNGRLGVVTPVYNTPDRNRMGYLVDAVDSALAQDIDYTFLIVDNGSTDEETLDFYETINDPRVRVERIGRTPEQKGTPSVSLNFGFNLLFNEGHSAFCYLHSDDLLTQGSLERRVNALGGFAMVYGRMGYYDDREVKVGTYPTRNHQSPDVMISAFPHHSSMWSRKLMGLMLSDKYRKGEIFGLDVKSCEDFDCTLFSRKIIERGELTLGFVDACLYVWMDHDGNISHSITSFEHEMDVRYIYRKNGYRDPDGSFLMKNLRRPGFWLPESVKQELRPLKNKINKFTFGFMFNDSQLVDMDMDLYWFRERDLVP